MQTISIILLTLYHTTLSQILDENDYLDEDQPSARRFSAVGRFINVTVTTGYSLSMLNKMIQNYGCHCYPGYSKTPGGRGQAVDGQDEICRRLARCHQCVMLDHGDTCNPADDGYKYEIDNSAGTISCAKNTDQCKMDSCLCDKQFAEDLGAMWDDSSFDLFYWKNKNNNPPGGTFDYDTTCQAQGFGQVNNDCCGTYPTRKPFSNVTFECCTDGSVKPTGNC